MGQSKKTVLEINSSGRMDESVSRALGRDLVAALESRYGEIDHIGRNLDSTIPYVNEAWINANFTPEEERSAEQRETLALSDSLVAQLSSADIVVIGVPIYNFSVPAALKAWIDMIARARLTFRYTENGPRGLLTGKRAYLVVTSGGVAVGSPMDFATPYLRQALSFVGIDDIEIIAADQLNSNAEESMDQARVRIAELAHKAAAA